MKIILGILSVGFSNAQNNAAAIDKVQQLLEDFKVKLTESGAEAAKLYEEQACTCQSAFDNLRKSISLNQGNHDEVEGERQKSQAINEKLNSPKTIDGSIAHSKSRLIQKMSDLQDKEDSKKIQGQEAMRTISQSQEAIVLIESAEAALQASTEKVSSLQSFLQLKSRLKRLGIKGIMDQEQPSVHSTSNDGILVMLSDLKMNVSQHLAQVRSTWTETENKFVNEINKLKLNIASLETKISDDTKSNERERSKVLAADQKMHDLKLQINSDIQALKDTTERCDEKKREFESDKETRLEELRAVSEAHRLLVHEFSATLQPSPFESQKVVRQAVSIQCELSPPYNPSSKSTSFITTYASTQHIRKKQQTSFLQRFIPSNGYEKILASLVENKVKNSSILTEVMSSLRRRDPLKKVRTMIENLIQRLKDESQNEQSRNEYCTTEETKKQEGRAAKKKNIKSYESALQTAQEKVLESKAQKHRIKKDINELLKTCSEENGQFDLDLEMHKQNRDTALHGKQALKSVLAEMGSFFSSANNEKNKGSYSGDKNHARGITGLLEAIISDFQKTLNVSTEEILKLDAEKKKLIRETSRDVHDKDEQLNELIEKELKPAETSRNNNRQALEDAVQEYSLLTEELIIHKYDSSACRDNQLTKEEEAENKEAEIQALKDTLAILNERSASSF